MDLDFEGVMMNPEKAHELRDDLVERVNKAINEWRDEHHDVDLSVTSSCIIDVGLAVITHPFSTNHQMNVIDREFLRRILGDACDDIMREQQDESGNDDSE